MKTEVFLGIDTSNYTTSAAVFHNGKIVQNKKLLPVAAGQKGLRQSDAVFSHIRQIDEVLSPLLREFSNISLVGVSDRPRAAANSYMPCFMAGVAFAEITAAAKGAEVLRFSHQQGHIAAALYSADKLHWLKERFIAFHVSGGTTEALFVTPNENHMPMAELIAESTDLKAGQAIDRAGVMMELGFPCGSALEKLSLMCDEKIDYKPAMLGKNCSLSGIENKCKSFLEKGKSKEYIAKFCIEAVIRSLAAMYEEIAKEYGKLPVLFSGGVTANKTMRERFETAYGAAFASPEFAADNAAGTAILAKIMRCGL